MNKEVKAKEETKEKKCDCGPDCKCGCQEGKECTCGDKGCGCHHGKCGCSCGCAFGKLLILALVFFAGMGVNQFMNDTCLGHCPARKGMRPMPMMQAPQMQGSLQVYKDGHGNTIIIVTPSEDGVKHGCNCGSDCKCGPDCKCGHHKFGKHHRMKGMPPHGMPAPAENAPENPPENPQAAE